jgi:hypothetical protein
MNRATRSFAAMAAGLLLLLHGAGAAATITQVDVNPAVAAIPGDRSSSLSLTWRATSTPDAAGSGGGGSRVTSTDGVFRADTANGTVIGTSGLPLDGVAQGPTGQPGIATLSETVTVPLSVLQQAASLGAIRIVYQRVFSDGTPQRVGGNVASVTLNLTTALQVDVNPPFANAAVGQASTVSLTWRVSGAGTAGAFVSSPRGEFRAGGAGGQLLGVRDEPLQGETRSVGGVVTAILPETVDVPARVLMRAEQLGVRQIAYLRSFGTGGAQPGTGSALLNLAGPLGGPFSVTGVTLRFEDGGRQSVFGVGEDVVAFADVTHTGTGRLEAQWEIAEPSSTRSAPVFRALNLVRRQLTGSGAATRIRSPALPSAADGTYLVRLRITRPDAGFEMPALRYFVNPALDVMPEPVSIVATAPASGAMHRTGTRFSWQPVPAASTYRVEFHERAPEAAIREPGVLNAAESMTIAPDSVGEPVSGIVLDADSSDTELSRLALSHLPPGRSYWWRVLAYDEAGRIVGRSELRRLYVPAPDGES